MATDEASNVAAAVCTAGSKPSGLPEAQKVSVLASAAVASPAKSSAAERNRAVHIFFDLSRRIPDDGAAVDPTASPKASAESGERPLVTRAASRAVVAMARRLLPLKIRNLQMT